ncbi:MAG: hypothetical protein ACFFF4_15410, partial [Candidatus Thorarchaeota archaeon]
MARNWQIIAKAEFLVMTSRFRKRRRESTILIFLIGFFWAIIVAPAIMSGILNIFSVEVQVVLAIAFPGLMRAVILLLWVMVLVFPISQALQEIQIGQWEIMLSNNVSSRDMLTGMFLGKIPSYGLLVLFMAPVLLSPFMIIYEVSILGQILAYLVITVFALTTLFLSTIISTAIQAKLGDSPRGNDIAKAMGIVVVIVFLLPLYSIMYFAEGISQLMGLSVFLLLPSTWGADIITWITIYFNGVDLPASSIRIFEEILGLPAVTDILLIGCFAILVTVLGLTIPDRLFTFEGGARTEKITTVGRENIALRGIRRLIPGYFGLIVISTLKDFGRKAQNISRLIYAIFLSILFPIMLSLSGLSGSGELEFKLILISFMLSLILGMLCGITFGGMGFLESKDHLWLIKSTPKGVSKYVKARLLNSALLGVPMVLIPVSIVSIALSLDFVSALIILAQTYIVLIGSILV